MLFKFSLFFSFWTLLQQVLLTYNGKTAGRYLHVNHWNKRDVPKERVPMEESNRDTFLQEESTREHSEIIVNIQYQVWIIFSNTCCYQLYVNHWTFQVNKMLINLHFYFYLNCLRPGLTKLSPQIITSNSYCVFEENILFDYLYFKKYSEVI